MKVLAIDGGGVRGVVPSAFLAYWEAQLGTPMPDKFEMFVGTSTGAIVAGSLAAGLSAADILKMFREETASIFGRENLSFAKKALSFKGWALPAYSADHLKRTLESRIGDVTLGDCPRPLAITSLDVVTGNPKIFRSGHHPDSGSDKEIRIVDAILASSAAPTYFPSVQVGTSTYVDGALWANNPALVAILEAKKLAMTEPNMLSLGCGRPVWGKSMGWGEQRGAIGWGGLIIPLLMTAQSDGVHGYIRQLVSTDSYLRIDPPLPKELAFIDRFENVPELLARGEQTARESICALEDRFE